MRKLNIILFVLSFLLIHCDSDDGVSSLSDLNDNGNTTEKTKFELLVIDDGTNESMVASITSEIELVVDPELLNTELLDPDYEVCESVEWERTGDKMTYYTTKDAFDARFTSNIGPEYCMISGNVSFVISASGYVTKNYSTRFYQGENKVVTIRLEKE